MKAEFYLNADRSINFIIHAENDAERLVLRLFEEQVNTSGNTLHYHGSTVMTTPGHGINPGHDSFKFGCVQNTISTHVDAKTMDAESVTMHVESLDTHAQEFVESRIGPLIVSHTSNLGKKLYELFFSVPIDDISLINGSGFIFLHWREGENDHDLMYNPDGSIREVQDIVTKPDFRPDNYRPDASCKPIPIGKSFDSQKVKNVLDKWFIVRECDFSRLIQRLEEKGNHYYSVKSMFNRIVVTESIAVDKAEYYQFDANGDHIPFSIEDSTAFVRDLCKEYCADKEFPYATDLAHFAERLYKDRAGFDHGKLGSYTVFRVGGGLVVFSSKGEKLTRTGRNSLGVQCYDSLLKLKIPLQSDLARYLYKTKVKIEVMGDGSFITVDESGIVKQFYKDGIEQQIPF